MKLSHKSRISLAAALLSLPAFSAHADSRFVGIDVGLLRYRGGADILYIQNGTISATYPTKTTDGFGFRAGGWFNEHFGVEFGLNNLGSSSGAVDVIRYHSVITYTTTEKWNLSANAMHVAALLGDERMFVRLGAHVTTTSYEQTGYPVSSNDSSGLFLGAGSNIPVSQRVALQASFNMYKGVVLPGAFSLTGQATTRDLYWLSLGAEYIF